MPSTFPADRIEWWVTAPTATRPQVHRAVADAVAARVALLAVPTVYAGDVAKALAGDRLPACALVALPFGLMRSTAKAIEATMCSKDGVAAIAFTPHLPPLLKKDAASVRAEALELVKAVRANNPRILVRMIIEAGWLEHGVDAGEAEARIEAACQASRGSGCDGVVSGTGFLTAGPASPQAVAWMRKHSGGLEVVAAGPRDEQAAHALLAAGADRVAFEVI